MSSLNRGQRVIDTLAAIAEFGEISAMELADYLDIGRYDAHAVLNRMSKRTKAGLKRIYVVRYTHDHDGARRYPRAVYAIGDKRDAKKPESDVRANRRRCEHRSLNVVRMSSVFNLGLSRDKIKELRRAA